MRKILLILGLLCPSLLPAQQPQYGGIVSNHPITTTKVLGVEETWLGIRSGAGTTKMLVSYGVTCDNGNGGPGAIKTGNFIASNPGTNNAASGFAGTGQFFPCNGWLNWANMLIYAPNTIGPGELMVQLEIHNAMPIGWNPAGPAANGATSTTVQQSILTGTIEEVLYNCSVVSAYAVSWPSATGCSGNPVAYDPGTVQNINVANPAAATNWTLGGAPIFNGNVLITPINITYTLATDANAGNRYACVQFLTGGVAGTVVAGPFCSPYAQPASMTVTYNFSAGIGWATNCSLIGATQTATKCPSIEIPLPAGWVSDGGIDNFAIDSIVLNDAATPASGFKAADQLSAINVRVKVQHAHD